MSTYIVPRNIIALDVIEYKHFCIKCGGYVQMNEPHGNNTRLQCTIGSLLLRPKGNSQGGYYVYILNTGHQLKHKMCTTFTIPDEVI